MTRRLQQLHNPDWQPLAGRSAADLAAAVNPGVRWLPGRAARGFDREPPSAARPTATPGRVATARWSIAYRRRRGWNVSVLPQVQRHDAWWNCKKAIRAKQAVGKIMPAPAISAGCPIEVPKNSPSVSQRLLFFRPRPPAFFALIWALIRVAGRVRPVPSLVALLSSPSSQEEVDMPAPTIRASSTIASGWSPAGNERRRRCPYLEKTSDRSPLRPLPIITIASGRAPTPIAIVVRLSLLGSPVEREKS